MPLFSRATADSALIPTQSWLIDHMNRIPFQLSDIGEWWGNHSDRKKEIQIDIVGIESKAFNRNGGKRYLIGSCKYRNELVGFDELSLLEDYASVITTPQDQCFYYIFSKSGFTEALKKRAAENTVSLLTLEEMYGD